MIYSYVRSPGAAARCPAAPPARRWCRPGGTPAAAGQTAPAVVAADRAGESTSMDTVDTPARSARVTSR